MEPISEAPEEVLEATGPAAEAMDQTMMPTSEVAEVPPWAIQEPISEAIEPIPEQELWQGAGAGAGERAAGVAAALRTLTSGVKKDLRGGSIQAHICVVRSPQDIEGVLQAFRSSDNFRSVASWSYAVRLSTPAKLVEGIEDGLDEGCGEKILGVLRRNRLQGLLLVLSRWQDYGASAGMDLHGTTLYAQVVERCKDLIANLKQVMGLGGMEALEAPAISPLATAYKPEKSQTFDFSFLPAPSEPKTFTKYGPNHFLCDSAMNRPPSMPNLFNGGDVRLWVANDQCLKQLSEADLWSLRSLRQPDWRIEEVLQAVAALRGQKLVKASNPAARWGHAKEVLKSPTLRTELLLFDADTVPVDDIERAAHLLEGLEVEEVRRANPAAGALLEWAQGVVRWRLQGPPPEGVAAGPPTPAGTGTGNFQQPLQFLQTREASQAELRKTAPVLPSIRRSASAPRGLRAGGPPGCRDTVPRKRVTVGLGMTLSR